MQFTEYQARARRTDQRGEGSSVADDAVHLLGLAGEAGSVASAYKKHLRDGLAHGAWKAQMREELGDALWYLAVVADRTGLDLNDVALASLVKTESRWVDSTLEPFDRAFPASEQLPASGTYEFREVTDGARPGIQVWFEGRQIGDEITDASSADDGYRFHDVFHLSYTAMLRWSPVTRAVLGCKRRSDPAVDEDQDGGRARVAEEAISALVFAYATQHMMLADVERVDQHLLSSIQMLAGPFEVGVRTARDWERAIIAGFRIFRQLVEHGSGQVRFDADQSAMTFAP